MKQSNAPQIYVVLFNGRKIGEVSAFTQKSARHQAKQLLHSRNINQASGELLVATKPELSP